MNMKVLNLVLAASALAAIAACGGGGDDEAGSSTALSTQPTTLTATAVSPAASGPPLGTCAAGFLGEVFIYGGVPPYRLDNTAPDAIVLDKAQVGDRAGSFKVSVTTQCISPGIIVIRDQLDKQITVTINNKPASS